MTDENTPYRDRKWQQVRARVLERDGGRCQLQLPKCRTVASHADHVIDWRDGGAWFDLSNLRAACSSCNTAQRNTRVAARARAHRDGTGALGPFCGELCWDRPTGRPHWHDR